MEEIIYQGHYFNLTKIGSCTYAAIKTNPYTMSNACFIDLGDIVVVFDTFLSLDASKELKEIMSKITQNKKYHIINSHEHADHFLGNQVFKDALSIISSSYAYEEMKKQSIDLNQKPYFKQELIKLKETLHMTSDISERMEIENSIYFFDAFSQDELSYTLPNLTINEDITIHGLIDDFTLRVIQNGHTKGDIIGLFYKERIGFLSDLVFVNEHPNLTHCDPLLLKETLQKCLELPIDTIVPGHGPICGKEKILEQIEYIDSILHLIETKDSLKDISLNDLPLHFQKQNTLSFNWNIHALFSKYKK